MADKESISLHGRAATRPPWIVPLNQLGSRDIALAGGKGAHLGEMLRSGLPVPDGFCVTTEAFRYWLDGHPAVPRLLEQLAALASETTGEVREVASKMRAELLALSLPEPLREAVREEIQRRGSEHAWAVRSSGTAEDLPEASFAGQHDSLLNVRGDEAVLAAIRHCWASLFTDRAVVYRSRNGILQSDLAMAVVVQEMVPAEVSGVMFTADPLTGGTNRVVIEVVQGLGEKMVSGRVNPDRWVLDKETLQVVERTSIDSRRELVPETARFGSSPEVGQVAELVKGLNDTGARRLGELGRVAERLFGRPQDIEWAARDSQFSLLQARAITALPPVPGSEPDVWTNANIMEALPEVVTPMSWSLMQTLLDDFLNPLMRRLDLDTSRPLMGLIGGRAYLNVRAIAALVQQIAGPMPVNVMAAFGGQHSGLERAVSPKPPHYPGARKHRRVWHLLRLGAWLLPGLVGQQRLLERWGLLVMGDLARTPPASLSDERLAQYPRALLQLAATGAGERTWAAAAWMGITGVVGSALLFRLTQKWLGDADHSVANRLLAGTRGMQSAENGLELLRLAAWARQQPELKTALLEPVRFEALERKLSDTARGREFLERWQTFMKHHGHQARGGMDIAQPRWSEMPDFVLDMLRVYLQFDAAADPLVTQAHQRAEREDLLTDCRRRLRNPLRRLLFIAALRAAHRGLTQRENVKNEGVRMVALLRRAALEAGRRLTERGLLHGTDEVFFLRLEELAPALCGEPAFDTPAVIRTRKAEHARLASLDPPPVVVGEYKPARVEPAPAVRPTRVLQGVAVSPGVATGKARVILRLDEADRIEPGEILVAPFTDPGWTPYFLAAAGVVVDIGGLLSHGSVVAREYGLPAVVNVGPATRLIQTGQRLQVDGNRGVVTLLD